jgi:hypothetical protein
VSAENNDQIDNLGFAPSQIELLAASLRFNASDISNSMLALATLLESIAPQNCQVKKKKRGLRSKSTSIEEISIQLGEYRFLMSVGNGTNSIRTTRLKIVRDIVIKTDDLPVDQWIASLAEMLALESQRSESARIAISKLLGAN